MREMRAETFVKTTGARRFLGEISLETRQLLRGGVEVTTIIDPKWLA